MNGKEVLAWLGRLLFTIGLLLVVMLTVVAFVLACLLAWAWGGFGPAVVMLIMAVLLLLVGGYFIEWWALRNG